MAVSHRSAWQICVIGAVLFFAAHAHAQVGGSAARGELLYTTHCIECHTSQVHWRDKRLATNWASLQAQVVRWQANAGLSWSQGEIEDVSRYLNDRYYKFSVPVKLPGAGHTSRPTSPL
jgi:mono/diheme cytochrome c family protein